MRITHFSDLHLTEKDGMARSEPKLYGKLTGMNQAFTKLAGHPIPQASDLIVFTGDITDSGKPSEWAVFWQIMKKAGSAIKRDIPEVSGLERWGKQMPISDRQALRLLCITHKVRLVLHGHLHRPEDRRVNGVRMIGAPASTEPIDGRYWFYSYEVKDNGSRGGAAAACNQLRLSLTFKACQSFKVAI